jgi:hypothetical protein
VVGFTTGSRANVPGKTCEKSDDYDYDNNNNNNRNNSSNKKVTERNYFPLFSRFQIISTNLRNNSRF